MRKLRPGPPRTDANTREIADRVQQIDEQDLPRVIANNLERDTGVRYSILNELEYHKIISNHAVEPMHNLLLGENYNVMLKGWYIERNRESVYETLFMID